EERRKGKKCLEIKYIQDKPYVYYSTSTYDRATKKTKKISRYIRRLTPDLGLLVKGSTSPSQDTHPHSTTLPRPKSVFEYGSARLLGDEFIEMIPVLKEAFPEHWEEIVALVFTRLSGYLPLKRVKSTWES
ncbi:MAG: hypothetical protein GXY48_10825, partial [Methanomicrobiales archaeon]|nr:hypothetical protein [Methanomicrobiales archaeon]